MPYSGGNNLWFIVQRVLRILKLPSIGRDKLAQILKNNGLNVIKKRKSRKYQTTYSNHQYSVQPNLIKNIKVTQPGEVLVADITYIRTKQKKDTGYLFLVTDAFTRMIAGYHFSRNLKHTGAIKALEMAADNIPDLRDSIHHTDRGVQYCCHNFIRQLKEYRMKSSMTDSDHAAQNALAECINSILKREFGLHRTFDSFESAQEAVDQGIFNYNHLRIHGKLKGRTPVEAFFGNYNFFNLWAQNIAPSLNALV